MSSKTIDEIKEATKRFCRTDKAADNLAEYIQDLITEAKIEELQKVHNDWRRTYQSEKVQSNVEQRLAQLKEDN